MSDCVKKIDLFCKTNMAHCIFNNQDGAATQSARLCDWLRHNFNMERDQWYKELQLRMDAICKKKDEYETWKDTLNFAQQRSHGKRKRSDNTTTVTAAIPTTVTAAIPTTVTDAIPTTVTDAIPTTVTDAIPTTVPAITDAIPTTVIALDEESPAKKKQKVSQPQQQQQSAVPIKPVPQMTDQEVKEYAKSLIEQEKAQVNAQVQEKALVHEKAQVNAQVQKKAQVKNRFLYFLCKMEEWQRIIIFCLAGVCFRPLSVDNKGQPVLFCFRKNEKENRAKRLNKCWVTKEMWELKMGRSWACQAHQRGGVDYYIRQREKQKAVNAWKRFENEGGSLWLIQKVYEALHLNPNNLTDQERAQLLMQALPFKLPLKFICLWFKLTIPQQQPQQQTETQQQQQKTQQDAPQKQKSTAATTTIYPKVLPFGLRHTKETSVNQVLVKLNAGKPIFGLVKNQWYQAELPFFREFKSFQVRYLPYGGEEDEDDLNRTIRCTCKQQDTGLYQFKVKDLSNTFENRLKYFEFKFLGDGNKTFVISPVAVVSKVNVLRRRGFN